jgi:8-oxo-dGTP pyrophosphatase MutT (NUDIX family)
MAAPRFDKIKKYFNNRKNQIQEIVREPTSGGIVFRHNPRNNEIEFLLIQDSKDRWTIPKGHIEQDETAEVTAAREIIEETGLWYGISIIDWLGKINFRYRREQSLVLMTTEIFLVQIRGNDTDDLRAEDWIHDIQWFSAAEALDKIEYGDIGKLMLLAMKKIRQGKL